MNDPLITFEAVLRAVYPAKPIKVVYKPSKDSIMVSRGVYEADEGYEISEDSDFEAQQAMDDRLDDYIQENYRD